MKKKPGPKKGTKHSELPRSEFAKNLITIRKKRGVTQVELAKRMKISQRVITFYECESKGPTPELLKKFAKALNVAPQAFFGKSIVLEKEEQPSKAIRNRLPVIAKLPYQDQQSLARMIDGMALQNGIKKVG